MFLFCGSGTILSQYSNFEMGDKGTLTHVLVEHGKAENEIEELRLTKPDKSKQRPSGTKAPNQEIKGRDPAKRIHVEENQSLHVSSRLLNPFRRTSRFLLRV